MSGYNPTVLERPKTIEEAVSSLAKWGSSARIVGGNTTLYELAREGALSDVKCLIDVSQLDLNYIRGDSSTLRIGAATTFTELTASPLLLSGDLYAIRETAAKVTPPQVRNTGTIGGSICSGIPFYDMPTTLLALDSKVRIDSSKGERTIDISEFFVDYFVTALNPEDMVVDVEVMRETNAGSAFAKLGRVSTDFAIVNVAVRIRLSPDKKKIESARVALGAVARTPIRADSSEKALEGERVSKEVLLRAAGRAVVADPTPSIQASGNYKKRVIPIVVRDALLVAVERAGGKVND